MRMEDVWDWAAAKGVSVTVAGRGAWRVRVSDYHAMPGITTGVLEVQHHDPEVLLRDLYTMANGQAQKASFYEALRSRVFGGAR